MRRVPNLLEELVADGTLMQIDDEYRLQTEEGAEWEKDYRSRCRDPRRPNAHDQLSGTNCSPRQSQAELGGLEADPGSEQDTEEGRPSPWGQDEPAPASGDVPVWIRDEWSVTEATVKTAGGRGR